MSRFVQIGARKLPTMLGAGILAVSIAGVGFAIAGITFSITAEVVSAFVGIVAAGKYA